MKNLPNVTLVCADSVDPLRAIKAIQLCQEEFEFGRTILFTHVDIQMYHPTIEIIIIPEIKTIKEYSRFMVFDLVEYIKTNHVLVVQWDGFIINPNAWKDEFLDYDYIGAPWWYNKKNVGNGGFSLRSRKLLFALSCENIRRYHPEDDAIGRTYHDTLVNTYGIKFAPEELAAKFSYEPNDKYPTSDLDTFGFHGIKYIHQILCKK